MYCECFEASTMSGVVKALSGRMQRPNHFDQAVSKRTSRRLQNTSVIRRGTPFGTDRKLQKSR